MEKNLDNKQTEDRKKTYTESASVESDIPLPQLDVNQFAGQLIALVIVFFILYMVIAKFFSPKMLSILNLRANYINSKQEEINKMAQETNDLINKSNQELASAYQNAQAIRDDSRSRIIENYNKKIDDLDRQLHNKIHGETVSLNRMLLIFLQENRELIISTGNDLQTEFVKAKFKRFNSILEKNLLDTLNDLR